MLGARLQRVDQPAPRHLGQQGVDGLVRVEVGLDVCDQANGAVPGIGAVRVVQQNQPAECVSVGPLGNNIDFGMFDLGSQRVAVRRQALRRSDGAQLDLRPRGDSAHGRYRLAEWGRFG